MNDESAEQWPSDKGAVSDDFVMTESDDLPPTKPPTSVGDDSDFPPAWPTDGVSNDSKSTPKYIY